MRGGFKLTQNYPDKDPGSIEASSFVYTGGGTFGKAYMSTEGRLVEYHTGPLAGTFIIPITLPDNFQSFKPDGLSILSRRDGVTTSLAMTMKKDGSADSVVNASDIKATADVTFEEKTFTPGSTYSPGDRLIFEIASTPGGPLVKNQICNLKLAYYKRWR